MKRTSLYLFTCIMLLCIASPGVTAQDLHRVPVPTVTLVMDSLRNGRQDTNRVRQLVTLGYYYEGKNGFERTDADSCIQVATEAVQLGNALHERRWRNQALLLKGVCLLRLNDIKNGDACYHEVINDRLQHGEQHAAAAAAEQFAHFSTETEDQLSGFLQARDLYLASHDTLASILAFKQYADIHLNIGEVDLCEKELLQVLADLKRLHYPKLYDTYYLLSAVNRLKGNLHDELYYILETVKGVEAAGGSDHACLFYFQAGEIYDELHMYPLAIEQYKKSAAAALSSNYHMETYRAVAKLNSDLLLVKRNAEALAVLQNYIKKIPPYGTAQQKMVFKCFGNYYDAVHNYSQAEKYYSAMLRAADTVWRSTNMSPEEYAGDYMVMVDFLMQHNGFNKIKPYVDTVLSLHDARIAPLSINHIQYIQFRADSAKGNYLAAIRHYQDYKQLNDSLFNVDKSKQIEELQIKYETDKKDKNLQLQAQNIQLLKKQSQIEKTQGEKTKITRNLMFISSGMLLLLLGVGFNRYRLKQRSNLQLQEQQREISAKNKTLEQLLHDNEWLLREVHHRVKNNLQIVMSLLNSQSAYLQDERALSAVLDSQHRVQAMSLIHQKLYKSDNVSNIYMPEYINDLVDYLKDSFETRNFIYFDQQIEPIVLDTVRAVPVGLILNEIITNAIKYAFPKNRTGNKIIIQLFISGEEEITLIVADNGKGLPADLDFEKINSFGIVLIKGLAEDLGGTFKIESDKGTKVTMMFSNKPLFKGGLQSVV